MSGTQGPAMGHRSSTSSLSSALASPTGQLCSRIDMAGQESCWTAGPYLHSSLHRAASQSESVTRRVGTAHQPARLSVRWETSQAPPALLRVQFRFRLSRADTQRTLVFPDPALH